MLVGRHRQHYEETRQMVCQLQAIAASQPDISEFQAIFLKVEQAGSSLAEGEGDWDVKAQSYQTEINKQLRLLKIDLMFLKSARQTATSEQRWATMSDRLHLLIIYCDTLLSQDF